MKIALVNSRLQLGGAETVVNQLWKGLAEAGIHVSLHLADGKHFPRELSPLYPRLLSFLSHTRFHSLIERYWPRYIWTDAAFRKLANSDADLVHLHNFVGNYATVESLAFLALRKPVVWTFHGFWGITGGCVHPKECERYLESCGSCPHLGEWPLTQVDHTADQLMLKLNLLLPAPLQIIAPSHYVADRVRMSKVGRNWKVHHIPNGVDTKQFRSDFKQDEYLRCSLGLNIEGRVILVASRNFRDPEKGFTTIRDALSTVPLAGVQILLVGENSEWALSQLSGNLSCVSLGYVSSRNLLARCMEASDIFLFASAAENFPCIILEAMAAGCCVVATPSGGVVEQITHRKTGFLSADLSSQALASVLMEALSDPATAKEFALASRLHVNTHFSEDRMIERHLSLYDQILSK